MSGSMVASGTATVDAPAIDAGGGAGSALLGQAAVLVWNDVDREGREQFYRWHDGEHIPERLAIPGFRRGRRFIRPGHSPEWLTMYEATDLSVLVSAQYLARLNAPTPATASALKHFRNTSRAVCRLVRSVGSSTGGHVLAMRLSVAAARGDAMCRYLSDDAFPRAMDLTGIVACHLYAADPAASYLDTAESSTRAFDVPSWVLLCESTTPMAASQAGDLIDGPEFGRLGVEVRSDAAIYALEVCRLSLAAGPAGRDPK
jgi:hypothetical protein